MTTVALADLPERFRSKVSVNGDTGCWEWTASRSTKGYGLYWYRSTMTAAHRFAYESLVAMIPTRLQLDHLCRVRHCVNPSHLEPVTNQVNTLRGAGPTAVNATKTTCPSGHEYDGLDRGKRYCRRCANAKARARVSL